MVYVAVAVVASMGTMWVGMDQCGSERQLAESATAVVAERQIRSPDAGLGWVQA